MGEQAVQTASTYSLENYMQKLLKIYREIGAKDTPRDKKQNTSGANELLKRFEAFKQTYFKS